MKPNKIVFIDASLEKSFNQMPDKDPVKKGIIKAIKAIKQDATCGRNVQKKLIPKKIIKKYSVNNLWIYDLPGGWRLIYSVAGDKIEIIAAVLEWMNHKDYERLFGFT